jgi:hypothetical protein
MPSDDRPPTGSPRQRLEEIAKQADLVRQALDERGDLDGAADAAEIHQQAEALRGRLADERGDADGGDLRVLIDRGLTADGGETDA